ncbi:tRNA(Ile)-lysidine synthase [Chlamydiales bacterium SCGC AG-110-P3]|nr:tRNA(Ile)-lysidine synthase [Chlamydiales bacterium SCGC AG-110-P3]
MNSSLACHLQQFLDQQWDFTRPLIVALSGGVDSAALLDVLTILRPGYGLDLHVAHVDHGWRTESREQADYLEIAVMDLGLPFHRTRLDPSFYTGNLETAARLERMAFFVTCCRKVGAQAVILGHHADDQAETVLKRTLQGNALPYLNGMDPVASYEGIPLWRPLLGLSKAAVTQYATQRELSVVDDPTNRDDRFLRTRMRRSLFPLISEYFGKEVRGALSRLGDSSRVLHEYLDRRTDSLMAGSVTGPFGVYLAVREPSQVEVLELEHVIRRVVARANIRLPYSLVSVAAQLLQSGSANKKVATRDGVLFIDRCRLFAVKGESPERYAEANSGSYWHLKSLERGAVEQVIDPIGVVWSGFAPVAVPDLAVRLQPAEGDMPVGNGKVLSDWWTECKTPAFLRQVFPVLCFDGQVIHDFLSGRSNTTHIFTKDISQVTIALQYTGLEMCV